MVTFKHGANVTEDRRDFEFSQFAKDLAPAPAVFGHEALVTSWGMLANDSLGDCVPAGWCHQVMLWTREDKKNATFQNSDAISLYEKLSGYTPSNPNSDQGTDPRVAAKYAQKTGIKGHGGAIHKIAAYVSLAKGNTTELANATYYFTATGVAINFPESAMDQFNAGQPWDVVAGAQIDGGHYVTCVGRAANGNFLVVTWGQVQEMTPAFYEKYSSQTYAYLSNDEVYKGKSPEGFSAAQLAALLQQVG